MRGGFLVNKKKEKKVASFQVDPEFHDRLKVFAESSGLKISQLCRYALAREIDSTWNKDGSITANEGDR